MPRRKRVLNREILPDPIYHSKVVKQFINGVMYDGKQSTAARIVYDAIQSFSVEIRKKVKDIADNSNLTDDKLFEIALQNVSPHVEVRSRRVGGATYQVPVDVKQDRSTKIAMRWVINAARKSGKSMSVALRDALVDSYNSTGEAYKKLQDMKKMAQANLAFSHFKF